MTTDPKYAVRVNDLRSPVEAEKVSKIICNGKRSHSRPWVRERAYNSFLTNPVQRHFIAFDEYQM